MTVQQALAASGIELREARLLLGEATGLPQSSLVAFPEKELSEDSERTFLDFVARRRRGEPVAYILGRKEFYGLELIVSRDVLIPRPETELLVDLALERRFSRAVDLGTGSGAIALAIKGKRPSAHVIATEASAKALAIARANAARLQIDVEFRLGRWLEPLGAERFDLILANPPYVAEGDPHLADLAYEPAAALVAGPEGLDELRRIVSAVSSHLEPGGRVLLEHGIGQDAAVRALLEEGGLEGVRTWPDLSGIPRVTGGTVK